MENVIQQLIATLLDNFILVFIIGGVIINIFKRFKDAATGQNTQQRPVEREVNIEPTFEEQSRDRRIERNPFETIFDELNRKGKEISDQIEKSNPSRVDSSENKASTASTELYERYKKRKEENVPSVKNPPLKSVKHETSQYKPMKRVTKKRAVEGVIWSEILGPPRSKRPHSTTGQYSRTIK